MKVQRRLGQIPSPHFDICSVRICRAYFVFFEFVKGRSCRGSGLGTHSIRMYSQLIVILFRLDGVLRPRTEVTFPASFVGLTPATCLSPRVDAPRLLLQHCRALVRFRAFPRDSSFTFPVCCGSGSNVTSSSSISGSFSIGFRVLWSYRLDTYWAMFNSSMLACTILFFNLLCPKWSKLR